MRAAFHDQLDEISDLLAEMAVAAGTAMNQATQALLNSDLAVAEAVISGDDHLDELTSEVELCLHREVVCGVASGRKTG